MERYSLIVVADETAPIRRFDILKSVVHRVLWGVGAVCVLLTFCLGDYVSLRRQRPELQELRVETQEQRAQIRAFEANLDGVKQRLARIAELERKVRIIANLPGSAGTGGIEITEAGGDRSGDLVVPNADSESDPVESPDVNAQPVPADRAQSDDPASPSEPLVSELRREAVRLGLVADSTETTLMDLVSALENKHHHLDSSPAIWPTKGWLTSRFGYRISPFTTQKQFHAGIDIAGRRGTSVIAPARGRVTYASKRGPMGLTVILDHGYGVRTIYGHNEEVAVERDQEVARGQTIARLGSSGRSTGPHLHYVVEVDGKPRNPLDYIFD